MSKAAYIGIPNNPTVTLPSGYTQLEYIESTGTQYIDTGFKPNQDTRVVAKAQYTSVSGSVILFGTRYSVSSKRYEFFVTSSAFHTSYNATATTLDTATTDIIEIDKNKNIVSINGTTVHTDTYAEFQCSVNLYLFATNSNGSSNLESSARIYHCQIYDNGTLVRNFIPAKNSSGTLGLYDTVNSKFYTNDGSGTFKAGTALDGKSRARKVNKMYVGAANKPTVTLPSGYTQVEYIESNGTQYIDTGIVPNQYTQVDMVTTVTKVEPRNCWLFGSRTDSNTARYEVIWISSVSQYRLYHGSSNYAFNGLPATGDMNISIKHTSATINNITVTTVSPTFSGSRSIYLFDSNSNENDTLTESSFQKLKSCKIYDNGTLVRNFIPCKNASGTIGLYDLMNSKFYTNAGSGTFTAGTAYDGKSVARKVKKAYIGVNGIARVFFGGHELKYVGTAESISVSRRKLAGATVGGYAIFAGGDYSSNSGHSAVDAYSSSLTHTQPMGFTARFEHTSATVGNYALFAGGRTSSSSYLATVQGFDNNLTSYTPSSHLSTKRANLAGATVGDYALFAGGDASGSTRSSKVDTYNSSLTRSSATALSEVSSNLAGTSIGNYALFAGGSDGGTYRSSVNAYDSDLTRTSPTNLSVARCWLAGTNVGNYAIFAGGHSASDYSNDVDVYDKSLTKVSVGVLSVKRRELTATTLGDYAIFAGGFDAQATNTVDIFDTSLTMFTITGLSQARYQLASATVGNYALFAGGYNFGCQNTVYVYELV